MGAIAAAVKHMLKAGMSPEAVVEAVCEMEENPPRTARQERNRRYYENRKARLSASYSDVSDVSDAPSPLPNSPSSFSPTPPHITTPLTPPLTHARARKRPFPLPADWQPTSADAEWAAQKSYPRSFIEAETEKHALWAGARGVTRADWSKSWRNWLMRGIAAGRGPPAHESRVQQASREILEEIANRGNGTSQRGLRGEGCGVFDGELHPTAARPQNIPKAIDFAVHRATASDLEADG